MHSKKKLLNDASGLARSACSPLVLGDTKSPKRDAWLNRSASVYLILDRQVNSYHELFDITEKSILAGIDIIQLRDKNGSAKEILQFLKEIKSLTNNLIPLIINDRVDLAITGEASGVHLGQEDIPISMARSMMDNRSVIGVSCQTLVHAQTAQQDGADYIGFGSVFKTLTKPQRSPMNINLLEQVVKSIKIPVFAIGGINLNNVSELKEIGIRRIAVCRAICQAKDVEQTVKRFKENLKEAAVSI